MSNSPADHEKPKHVEQASLADLNAFSSDDFVMTNRMTQTSPESDQKLIASLGLNPNPLLENRKNYWDNYSNFYAPAYRQTSSSPFDFRPHYHHQQYQDWRIPPMPINRPWPQWQAPHFQDNKFDEPYDDEFDESSQPNLRAPENVISRPPEAQRTRPPETSTQYRGPHYADGTRWTGSNFNTDGNVSLSSVKAGHTVEIDPFGHQSFPDGLSAQKFIREAQNRGAKVVVYLPGGHVYTSPGGPDSMSQYTDSKWKAKYGEPLRFGNSGGVWQEKGERRVLDQSHPGFLARQQQRMLDCMNLGANGIRYDNLHSPSGGEKATEKQILAIYETFLKAKEQFLAKGGKIPQGGLGLVPHNSMPIWEKLIEEGKVDKNNIFMLGLERTTQLSNNAPPEQHPEILAAIRMSKKYGFGMAVTNFQTERTRTGTVDLDSNHPNYQQRVFDLIKQAGILGQVTTVPDENNYYSFDSRGRKPATVKFTR